MKSNSRRPFDSGQHLSESQTDHGAEVTDTLLNALAAFIPDDARVVVIEDTSEIQIEKPNLVRLEARVEQPDLSPVTIRHLLRATLRLRPDRILLGKVRGGEAFDLLQAMNTGHSGAISTIHANSAAQSQTRFTTCVMMAGIEQPHKTIRANIAEALHLLVHLERRHGKRGMSGVLRVKGYNPRMTATNSKRFLQRRVYEYRCRN